MINDGRAEAYRDRPVRSDRVATRLQSRRNGRLERPRRVGLLKRGAAIPHTTSASRLAASS